MSQFSVMGPQSQQVRPLTGPWRRHSSLTFPLPLRTHQSRNTVTQRGNKGTYTPAEAQPAVSKGLPEKWSISGAYDTRTSNSSFSRTGNGENTCKPHFNKGRPTLKGKSIYLCNMCQRVMTGDCNAEMGLLWVSKGCNKKFP